MTIQLFQPPCPSGTPNLSMFCAKTEILMQMSGLEFENVMQPDPSQGPKKKVPYIVDGGETVGDSSFIERHLNEHHGIDFYKGISDETRAIAQLTTSAIEEQLYWVMVYSRWQLEENWPIMDELFFGKMPPEMRENISKMARDNVVSALWGQGMGRHTKDQVFAIGARLIDNLAIQLADKPFFTGEAMTTVDASAYGALINFIQNPVPTPLKTQILGKPNLCAFIDRMSEKFFPNAERTIGGDALKTG